MGQFSQLLLAGVTHGAIYALIAVGFTVIYNCTQVVNFAQGEFVMLGAMITAVLVAAGKVSLPVACALSVVITTAVGLVLGGALLRPLRGGSVVTLIIITVGASILIRGVAMVLWGKDALPVPAFSSHETLHFRGVALPVQSLWVFAATALLVLALRLFYRRTLVGQAMRASASCKLGAHLVGINTNRMAVLSFGLAAGVGGVAGSFMAPITFAQYDMGAMLGLKGFCAAILGGLGNLGGGIIAGVILGALESLGAGFISSAYKDAIAFVVLLVILFARPEGVLGRRKAA